MPTLENASSDLIQFDNCAWPLESLANYRVARTLPTSSTAAAASVALCESMPIETKKPTSSLLADLRWNEREDMQASSRLCRTSMKSLPLFRARSERRDKSEVTRLRTAP
jgi:hypothetical protein